MRFETLVDQPQTARGELRAALFDDSVEYSQTRPLVDLIDGRLTNDDLEPVAWLDALEATDGAVEIFFELPADHEWWLAYDSGWDGDGDGGEYGLDGPFVRWSTYPSGGWDSTKHTRCTLAAMIDDAGMGVEGSGIRRSKVVRVEDAPEFVQRILE